MKKSLRFGIYPFYSEQCQAEVCDLIGRGGTLSRYRANPKFGLGPEKGSQAWHLEREIERKFKVRHAVVCNSGTAALHMALSALDLKGGEVVTSPYTFSATAAAILHAGGVPRFADVNPYTFCITKETVKCALTKETRAILPVHLFGLCIDIEQFRGFGVPVVEDACQAVGAKVGEHASGTQGVAGIYSFNGGKNLPAGEGGALVTNNGKIAEKARLMMNHAENFGTDWVGYNFRMTELEALVARHGLRALDQRNAQRAKLANTLTRLLWECPVDVGVVYERPHATRHVYYVYPFCMFPDDQLRRQTFIRRAERLGLKGWISGGYIRPILTDYPAFRKYVKQDCPVARELSEKTLCLLSCVRPPSTDSDIEFVADVLRRSLCESSRSSKPAWTPSGYRARCSWTSTACRPSSTSGGDCSSARK